MVVVVSAMNAFRNQASKKMDGNFHKAHSFEYEKAGATVVSNNIQNLYE